MDTNTFDGFSSFGSASAPDKDFSAFSAFGSSNEPQLVEVSREGLDEEISDKEEEKAPKEEVIKKKPIPKPATPTKPKVNKGNSPSSPA